MTIMACPHCGREYSQRACKPLVPEHGYSPPRRGVEIAVTAMVCPGSGQVPRNAESDRRPLWKDVPTTAPARRGTGG